MYSTYSFPNAKSVAVVRRRLVCIELTEVSGFAEHYGIKEAAYAHCSA